VVAVRQKKDRDGMASAGWEGSDQGLQASLSGRQQLAAAT
jgi:hypothetical protein